MLLAVTGMLVALPASVPEHLSMSHSRFIAADQTANDGADLAHGESRDVRVTLASVDDSTALKLLSFVLSVIAGSVDVIGFLGLDGLFIAHITGNIVVLAAKFVVGKGMPLSHLLAVPVFMVVLALTRLLVGGLERVSIPTLMPLLLLQFLLLLTFFSICFASGPGMLPSTASMIFASMLGVSAMAVQNALVRISLKGAPSTAVMTTNITVFGSISGNCCSAKMRAAPPRRAIVPGTLGRRLPASCSAALSARHASPSWACNPWRFQQALRLSPSRSGCWWPGTGRVKK